MPQSLGMIIARRTATGAAAAAAGRPYIFASTGNRLYSTLTAIPRTQEPSSRFFRHDASATPATSPRLSSPRPETQSQRRRQQEVRWSSSTSESEQFKQVGFEDINSKLSSSSSSASSSLILVDVREPVELASTGIIPGAVSVPLASQPDAYFLSAAEFEERFGYPKPGTDVDSHGGNGNGSGSGSAKKEDIVFYCKAGVRARAAAQLAVQAGYDPSRVRVYDGSWLDWVDHGGRVEKWERDDV